MNYKVFDTLLEPTFIINELREIIYCNEAAGLLCDMSVRKILRSKPDITQLFTFTSTVTEFDSITTITEPTLYTESGYSTQAGSTGTVQITIQPSHIPNNDRTWIVYFKNVTLEESLLSKYREELEQKKKAILELNKSKIELKNYSENLEKMVEVRAKEIVVLNSTMQALLDSLKQGLFIFDQDGNCLNVYSKACNNTIEIIPEGKKIWDIFKLQKNEIPAFKDWLKITFTELLPFEDMIPLAPQVYKHSQGKKITLEYYPMRNEENKIEGIVTVASDVTALFEAQQEAELERNQVTMILSLVKYRRQFNSFIRDSEVIFSALNYEFSQPSIDPDKIFRALHTMKGGSAIFSMLSVMKLCHQAETQLSQWKISKMPEDQEILAELCLKIKNEFQKFLTEQSPILGDLKRSQERRVEIPVDSLVQFIKENHFSEPIKASFIKKFLTEPLNDFISHYSEVIQKVAHNECKEVKPLVINSKNISLLPEPYEFLFNSMIHAFRNAVDHGIELPDVRLSKGKNKAGTIAFDVDIDAAENQNWLLFKISDDGAGIDPKVICTRLISRGVNCEEMTDSEIIQHVFKLNLSTKDVVTQTSGRGVGMDAIQYAAKQLGGKVWVESIIDKGSTLFIKVPYITTLQIEDPEKNKKAA